MKTRVLAGLALLASLSPDVHAQYISSGPYVAAEPAYGYHQPKEDCPPRVWFTAEYLRWWIKDAPQSVPLLTSGSATDMNPGALGQPNTRTLFGGSDLSFNGLNGLRAGAGIRLDADGCISLEGSMFLLEKAGVTFGTSSDAAGNPVLRRPFQNPDGTQGGLFVSFPTAFAGTYHGSTSSELFGTEVNLATSVYRCQPSKLELLAGFRYLRLEERLFSTQSSIDVGNVGTSFLGAAQPAGSGFGVSDSFETRNNIYAPQLGARYTWESGIWSLGLVGKVGLGWNNKQVDINGSTRVTSPTGVVQTAPGGLLAQTSNIGTYKESDFVVLPEVGATVGINVFPWLKVTGGYNFLYVNNVARPGDQIDPVVNTNLSPLSGAFGQGGAARPSFLLRDSDFWVHGWTAGLQIRW